MKPSPAPVQSSAVSPGGQGVAFARQLNLVKVQGLAQRNPKNCGYTEVSPGNWVHIDCGRYRPATRAVHHLSPRKRLVVRAHKQVFLPARVRKLRFERGPALPLPKNGASARSGAVRAAGAEGGGPLQIGVNFPSSVDHRKDGLAGPIKSQGGVGSCTAHSLSAALDNAAIRAGVLKAGDPHAMSSPMHIWSRYGQPNMGAAADGNIAQPVAPFELWPQDDAEACELAQEGGFFADDCSEAYSVRAGDWRNNNALMAKYDRSQASGIYKIAAIEKLETDPPNNEELMGILASGAGIWSALLIDGRNWRNKAMTKAVIPDWEEPSGGHAVLISGYRETPSGRQFLVQNSWGTSWGDGGYAWISERMVQKNLMHAYRVKITNGVPKDELTDDDCAPDELIDMTTGFCAVMCNGDERPNNGCR